MRLSKFLVSIAFGCLAVLSAYPQTLEWPSELFKVKILSDGYAVLIKRWGTPTDGTAEPERIENFKVAGGRVMVVFTNGTCESSDGDFDKRGWNVPERTVESINFEWGYTSKGTRRTPFTLTERNIDLTGFNVEETEFGLTVLDNAVTGTTYHAEKGFVASIHVRPSEEQQRKLRCETPN